MSLSISYINRLFTVLILILAAALISCSSSETISDKSISSPSEDTYHQDFDLTMHLRRMSGVQVRGDGANAIISIRAAESSSFLLSSSPLYVVDDQIMSVSYSMIYHLVNRNRIKNIRILNDSEAGAYGARGSNGVIVIELE